MYQKSSPESIQAMFASIATNYDKANSVFSLGLHKRWNQKLIKTIGTPPKLLDLCAGTGEIAFGFLKKNPHSEAILLDFCPEMLAIAQSKGKEVGKDFSKRFEIMIADAAKIPLHAASVDGVTISYGIRNVKEPEKCFCEVHRVLRDGGKFGILELTRPSSFVMRYLHKVYTHFLLPILGKVVAKNKDPYTYLVKSVQTFIPPQELEKKLRDAGFQSVERRPLMGGIATLLVAKK